jgi:hypothetical protein
MDYKRIRDIGKGNRVFPSAKPGVARPESQASPRPGSTPDELASPRQERESSMGLAGPAPVVDRSRDIAEDAPAPSPSKPASGGKVSPALPLPVLASEGPQPASQERFAARGSKVEPGPEAIRGQQLTRTVEKDAACEVGCGKPPASDAAVPRGFGKEVVLVGSGRECDVLLSGSGVAALHARILRQEDFSLMFVNEAGVETHCGGGNPRPSPLYRGRLLGPGESVEFDFKTLFRLGEVTVPLNHPAIAMMLMQIGSETAWRGRFVVGRDPSKSALVIRHPTVSGCHASLNLTDLTVCDEGSTSGTYISISKGRLPSHQWFSLDPDGVVAFGRVAIPVATLLEVCEAIASSGAREPAEVGPRFGDGARVGETGSAGVVGRHRMPAASAILVGKVGVCAECSVPIVPQKVTSFGRGADNTVPLSNDLTVSEHHAEATFGDGVVLIRDLRSTNGTLVNGAPLPALVWHSVPVGCEVRMGDCVFVVEDATVPRMSAGHHSASLHTCSACGSANVSGARFCARCGALL